MASENFRPNNQGPYNFPLVLSLRIVRGKEQLVRVALVPATWFSLAQSPAGGRGVHIFQDLSDFLSQDDGPNTDYRQPEDISSEWRQEHQSHQ